MLATDHPDLALRVLGIAMLSIGATILALLAVILVFRLIRHTKERRRQQVTALWRPLLAECLIDIPETLPSLNPREHIVFLYLWNSCYESIRGDATTQLVEVARRVGTHRLAKDLLHARLLRRRLLAVVTLGHLRERSVWNDLVALLADDNAFLSLSAANALFHIDAQAAIPWLIPVIGRRKDWSPLKLVSVLKAVEPDLAAETIAQAAIHAEPGIGARLIRHLAATRSHHGLPLLRQFLRDRAPSDDILAACLFLFGECSDPDDLPIIRSHLSHRMWYVRVQAAAALGKAGMEEDEARLIALLDDEQWWVRYRAGEALTNLPSMTSEKLAYLQVNLATIESQEILAPLLAKFRAASSPSMPAV